MHLARLQPGAHFGELALLSEKGAKRAATVRAVRPSGLLRIEEAEYRRSAQLHNCMYSDQANLYQRGQRTACLLTHPSIHLFTQSTHIRPSC